MLRSPFFSNRNRRAMYVVQWVLILIFLGISLYTMQHSGEGTSTDTRRRAATGTQTQQPYATEEETVETFAFDPNTADSTTLLRLGLAPWQVRAIYNYRAKHGRYHTAEDFMNVPGMTGEVYDRLAPYIRIAERFRLLRDTDRPQQARQQQAKQHEARQQTLRNEEQQELQPLAASSADSRKLVVIDSSLLTAGHRTLVPQRDTVLYPVKYPEGTLVDVNAADTTQLKKIPGIASYRARKIVQYREQLGGFLRLEQVMEACELPDEVLDWLELLPVEVRKINVNAASVQQMMRHPYITFYMARDINDYRRKKGRIADVSVLLKLGSFNEDIIEKLQDYLEF